MGAPIPHAALWVVQLEDFRGIKECAWSFNAARGFVGGAALTAEDFNTMYDVSMPHAALWVVQHRGNSVSLLIQDVSMPHAALWVVQRLIC